MQTDWYNCGFCSSSTFIFSLSRAHGKWTCHHVRTFSFRIGENQRSNIGDHSLLVGYFLSRLYKCHQWASTNIWFTSSDISSQTDTVVHIQRFAIALYKENANKIVVVSSYLFIWRTCRHSFEWRLFVQENKVMLKPGFFCIVSSRVPLSFIKDTCVKI